MTFRSLTGPKPPSWLILADGILEGTDAYQENRVKLAWMPLKEPSQNFRSCYFNLVRWKERMSLRKWKKTNPGWQKDLVEMKKETADEMKISFPTNAGKKSFFEPNLDLHLIMSWTSRDGRRHTHSWQISPVRSE